MYHTPHYATGRLYLDTILPYDCTRERYLVRLQDKEIRLPYKKPVFVTFGEQRQSRRTPEALPRLAASSRCFSAMRLFTA